ncbi:adenylosuccinate lyase, partial [Brachionus plicatilis]
MNNILSKFTLSFFHPDLGPATLIYESPLGSRYSSKEMLELFSNFKRIRIWRLLWLFLARGEKSLGLNITDEQIEEMERNLDNIDFDYAQKEERLIQHYVMAHEPKLGTSLQKFRNSVNPKYQTIIFCLKTPNSLTELDRIFRLTPLARGVNEKLKISKHKENKKQFKQRIIVINSAHMAGEKKGGVMMTQAHRGRDEEACKLELMI